MSVGPFGNNNAVKGDLVITKKQTVINIILSIAVMLFASLYLITDSLLAKAAASVCFASVGIINFISVKTKLKEHKAFSLLILCGLIMAMSGDVAINYSFIAGAVLFAVGHILFFVAQYKLCRREDRSLIRDIVCGICLFAVNMAILFFAPIQLRSAATIIICTIYAAIISLMTGKAISNFIASRTPVFRLMLPGTVLFMLSDILLVLYVFMGKIEAIHCISITLYYISEIIIADSYIALAKETAK